MYLSIIYNWNYSLIKKDEIQTINILYNKAEEKIIIIFLLTGGNKVEYKLGVRVQPKYALFFKTYFFKIIFEGIIDSDNYNLNFDETINELNNQMENVSEDQLEALLEEFK